MFCRQYKGYKTHFPLKTKWLPWQRIVNFGHFGQKFDHGKLDFLSFWRGVLCSWQKDVKHFNILLGRAVLCVIFKPKIMSSLIKISDVIHALYHWGLELRHFCKNCENGQSSMQNRSWTQNSGSFSVQSALSRMYLVATYWKILMGLCDLAE